jgi:hypothetical protein
MPETDNQVVAEFRTDVSSTVSALLQVADVQHPRCDLGGELAGSLVTKLLCEKYPDAYEALKASGGG